MQELLNFVTANPNTNEEAIAKALFNRRVLPARAAIRSALWSGKLTSISGRYSINTSYATGVKPLKFAIDVVTE